LFLLVSELSLAAVLAGEPQVVLRWGRGDSGVTEASAGSTRRFVDPGLILPTGSSVLSKLR
jgi:hypothetical protein